jgi:putative transposase
VERQEHCLVRSPWNTQPIGRPKIVTDQYLERLRELVSHSPRDFGYPFQRWTAQWLKRHLARETGLEVSDRHVNRLLKQMGLSTREKANSLLPSTVPPLNPPRRSSITINDLAPSSTLQSPWALKLRN